MKFVKHMGLMSVLALPGSVFAEGEKPLSAKEEYMANLSHLPKGSFIRDVCTKKSDNYNCRCISELLYCITSKDCSEAKEEFCRYKTSETSMNVDVESICKSAGLSSAQTIKEMESFKEDINKIKKANQRSWWN